MRPRQSYSCRPGAVYLPAGCKPGCAAVGKGSRDKAVLPHFQRCAADPGRGASIPLCKAWSGGAAGRREDAGADAEYGCGGSADWSQRYDAAVLSSSLSGTVPPGISQD